MRADAAAAHPRAFDQQKQRVGEQRRLRGARRRAEIGQALALAALEPFIKSRQAPMHCIGDRCIATNLVNHHDTILPMDFARITSYGATRFSCRAQQEHNQQ